MGIYLDLYFSPWLHDVSTEQCEEVVGGLGDLYLPWEGGALHATGSVDRVTKETEAGHLETNDSGHHRP